MLWKQIRVIFLKAPLANCAIIVFFQSCFFFILSVFVIWMTWHIKRVWGDRGPVHMRTNHVPKDVSERESALSWFESLILALVNTKLFQIRLLKCVLKREKGAFWIVICLESLILDHVNTKLFRNACAFRKCAIAIQNIFRNVFRSHVNTARAYLVLVFHYVTVVFKSWVLILMSPHITH